MQQDLKRVGLMSAAAMVLLLSSRPAFADDPYARGIDPVSFKLAPGDGFGTIEDARTMPPGHYRLDLGVDNAFGLLALRNGDEKIGDLLGSRLDLHLLLAIGLSRRFELGADLPVTLFQRHGFAMFEERGMDIPPPALGGAGDIRVTGKLSLPLPREWQSSQDGEGGWRAALVAELRLPTGDEESFLGERGFMLAPRAVVSWDGPHGWRLGGTAGYRWRSSPGRFLNLHVGDELHAGLAAAKALPPLPRIPGWDVFGELLVSTPARAPFAIRSPAYKTPLEAMAGLRFALRGGLEARVFGGTGLALESGLGRPALRLGATFGWAWPSRPSERRPARSLAAYSPSPGCVCAPSFVECPQPQPEPIIDEPTPVVLPEDPPYAVFDGERIELRGSIGFDTGKATLRHESLPVLDDLADLLERHAHIRRVRIDGHTDSVGSAAFNLNLSKQRAQSVVQYLVERGIVENRLSFAGFGQERPIESNDTAEGRARNRRVELTILNTD